MKARLVSIPMGPHPRAIEQKKKMWGELRKETQGGSTEGRRKAASKKLGSGPPFRKATLSGAKVLSGPDTTHEGHRMIPQTYLMARVMYK